MYATVKLAQTTCWCSLPFAVPAELLEQAHKNAHTIYCPLGHQMTWKQSEADKLRLERDRLKQSLAQRDDVIAEKDREIAAQKAVVTKMKKRASAGTCPCCQRTFQNMAIHMRKQHPGYAKPELKVVA